VASASGSSGAPAIRADLLSDTVTRPGFAMREAMATAVVGDDVFGEDPTLRELEARVAALLGHEAGLFTPSGSMANQLGVRLHVKPGEELIGDSLAHVLRAISPDALTRTRSKHTLDQIAFKLVDKDEPTTLEYLIRDYVDHLRFHLDQIFSETKSTE